MVILEGFIDISPEDVDLVVQELPLHKELTKREKGCIKFEINADNVVSNRFVVYEVFDSDKSFAFHQARANSSRWGEVTKNAVRNYNIKRQRA